MWTEYCTSYSSFPTQSIAKKSSTGPATVLIQGLGVGMISCVIPVIILVVIIVACDALAGIYGISLAAVGMLSTLGVTLAMDAFGPVVRFFNPHSYSHLFNKSDIHTTYMY